MLFMVLEDLLCINYAVNIWNLIFETESELGKLKDMGNEFSPKARQYVCICMYVHKSLVKGQMWSK